MFKAAKGDMGKASPINSINNFNFKGKKNNNNKARKPTFL